VRRRRFHPAKKGPGGRPTTQPDGFSPHRCRHPETPRRHSPPGVAGRNAGERRNADDAHRQLTLGMRLQPGERATDATYLNRVSKLRATVQQHEQNVASIQRELANLK